MLFNSKASVADKLSVESTYMLWRSLVDRNITIEHFTVLKNFVYDKEFKNRLEEIIKDYSNERNALRKLLNKYSVVGSDPSPRDQNLAVGSEPFTDQGIAEVLFRFMRLDVNLLMLSMKQTPYNGDIYDFLRDLAKTAVKRVDSFITYMKKKNWLFYPPEYRHSKAGVEKAATNAIYLLWDHLIFRYQNIRITQILSLYVKDTAFNALLTAGLKILQMEAKDLEDELLYLGVTLPKSYPPETVQPQDNSMYEDRFIFNHILRGIQDAVALHGSAIQEIVTNDRLRELFMDLTFRELTLLDKMIEFGKLKGWTNVTPEF